MLSCIRPCFKNEYRFSSGFFFSLNFNCALIIPRITRIFFMLVKEADYLFPYRVFCTVTTLPLSLFAAYKEDRSHSHSSSKSSKKKSRESSSGESGVNVPNDPSQKTLALLKKLVAKDGESILARVRLPQRICKQGRKHATAMIRDSSSPTTRSS